MVSRVVELFLLSPAKGAYLRSWYLGSLLILVFLRSRGGGSTGALSFFGLRGYRSACLGCCSMFPFLLKGEYNKGSWLIYCLMYYFGLYAGSYRFGDTINFMWVLFLWNGCE